MIFGALLGIASSFASARLRDIPWLSRAAGEWSFPALGLVLLTILGLRAALFFISGAKPRPKWNVNRTPYPGLEGFTKHDAGVFFGREQEIGQLVNILQLPRAGAHERVITVVGPSGVGKSSLVNAGLLPRLTGRRQPWITVTLTPTDRPSQSLSYALTSLLYNQISANILVDLAVKVSDADHQALIQLIDHVRRARPHRAAHALIVIDQAEELFTITSESARTAIISMLQRALSEDSRLWVLIVLRSEFLTEFLSSYSSRLAGSPVAVGVLDDAALLEIIEKPAAVAGIEFEPERLPHALVKDTGSGNALPLLAYTLQTLYLNTSKGGPITNDGYRQLGGVTKALTGQADSVLRKLLASDPDTPTLATLLRFVTVSEGQPTKRLVRRTELSDAELRVVREFQAASVS